MRHTHRSNTRPYTRGAGRILLCAVAICSLLGAVCAEAADAPIIIRGSSTLQPVAEKWVEGFGQQKRAPKFDLAATGSSEGIEALLSGQADIAMASRPMSTEERAAAEKQGLAIRETIVARMGIAVIVNRDNPVSSIAIDTVAEIFSGEVTNWQAVGGPDEPITVVRKTSGWSPDFFRRRVMGDRDFTDDSLIVESKEVVVIEVGKRPWSIGMTGMPEAIPALDRVSLLRLAGDRSDDATYALSRELFFFTLEDSPSVQPFLEYVTGATAQEMIVETGFYPAHQADAVSTE